MTEQTKRFAFELGDRLEDRVTGFRGIVVSRGDHISGCDTFGLQPEKLKDGAPQDIKWFDEPRLELIRSGVISGIDTRQRRTGADTTPPTQTRQAQR